MNTGFNIAKFAQLVNHSDKELCLNYIKKHKTEHDTSIYSYNPITYACSRNREDIVYEFIKQGVDVNMKDHYGDTALATAVRANCLNIAQFLIANRADINATTRGTLSVLEVALIGHHLTSVEFLIKNGANIYDVQYHNRSKYEPIRRVIYNEYHKIIVDTMNDKSETNVFAQCFRTTYVPQLVDIITGFIL
ncbi:MAG: hypothetical protein Faunusvirus3_5 [Faunusvirus sp.]|jgi:ankyrin repeat protein|uniref:Uncharacterized protein n=1 Tax=Faunusvirus sp. TaxID=2487766 RepID=A0A3G4ZW61_9VIRU|nr:MAG: hypothetical protein Faunusvirus3_5 [Faunusvirus sp.]